MRMLDLGCGAGGVAVGYHRAGFDEIVGVDIKHQRRFPFEFVQANMLEVDLHGFDFIHASPPCQRWSQMTRRWRTQDTHPDLITPIRWRLFDHWQKTGVPYVIENVPGSPLLEPLVLCGSMFGLEIEEGYLRRHRLFESTPLNLIQPPHKPPCVKPKYKKAVGVYGHGRGGSDLRGFALAADDARKIMGIDWMSRDELSEAIPPAYTEFLGRQVIAEIERLAVA